MTLKYNCFLILFFYCALLFSQSLEEQIYAATESFIAQKSQESFNELLKKEESFIPNIKTKDEQLAYVFLLCNKGFFYDESNKKMEAIESYENAWTRFKSNNLQTLTNYDIIEFCLKPLGNLYTKTNNYTSAESTIKQYMALAKSSDKTPQYISGVINLSILYQSLGKHQSVLGLIQSTETISGISKSQKEHLQNLKTKSEIANGKRLLDGDIIFPNQSQLANTHLLQYQASLKVKDYQDALKNLNLYKAYADIKTFPKREIAKLKFQEAQLLYLLSQFETCEQVLNSSLSYLLPLYKNEIPESSQLYPENTFIDIFDLKAQIQENPLTALAYFDLSFHVSGLLTKQLTSQQAIIENMAQNRQRSEACLAILYNLYKTQNKDAIFSQALNYAETYKAYTLKGMFEEKSLLEQYPNDSLLIKAQTLRQKQEHVTDVLIKQELNYVEQINLDSINSALLDINLELKALEKRIAEKYPNETFHIDVKQLQGKLAQDNAVLVEYFYGKEHLYQFIITKSNTSFKQLPLNEDLLSSFIHLFDDASKINNNVSSYTKSAFNCYQSLNLKEVGDTETLIIVPDGLLNFIPFDALLTAQATTESFSAMPFLVLSKQITYNASISLYLKNDTQSYGNAVLGVFPVFENTSQPLAYSLDEAHNLKKLTHATLQLKETATKTNFKNEAQNFNVLHLSTHATGGDFINPAAVAFHDEPLLLNELYGLNIAPNLVVLSACETGIGKLQKGEGAMSLARGFQYSGANNILFSLWQINDASTAYLMTSFYEHYTKTQSASFANRQSKWDYIKNNSISNIKKSPYYWSAFSFYGHIEAPKKDFTIIYYLFGILVLIAVVFLYFKFVRKS